MAKLAWVWRVEVLENGIESLAGDPVRPLRHCFFPFQMDDAVGDGKGFVKAPFVSTCNGHASWGDSGKEMFSRCEVGHWSA